jgi:hypothetical protein
MNRKESNSIKAESAPSISDIFHSYFQNLIKKLVFAQQSDTLNDHINRKVVLMKFLKMFLFVLALSFGVAASATTSSLSAESRNANLQTVSGMSKADTNSILQTAEKAGVETRKVVNQTGGGKDVVAQARSYGCSSGCSSGCSVGCSVGCR